MPPAARAQELTYEEVLRIVELVKTAPFSEFRLKVGDIEVHLRRGDHAGASRQPAGALPAAAPPAPETRAHAALPGSAASAPSESAPQPTAPSDVRFPEGAALVRAPMVGTFYRAPAPDAPPFVEIGSHVEPDTTVGIIEVMKLMNAIVSEVRGVVTQILVANAQHVEAGQALMVIQPDPEDG
jgi:acetyl-CoA carboxylase biotin carboxyl carrier protein